MSPKTRYQHCETEEADRTILTGAVFRLWTGKCTDEHDYDSACRTLWCSPFLQDSVDHDYHGVVPDEVH